LGAQLELVEALKQLNRLTEAATVASRAVAEHPQHASSHIALGLVKRRADDRLAALLAFARAAVIDAEHAFAHLELANELRAAGAHLEADVIIEKISLRCPDNPDVHVALGLARRRRNEREAALASFRSAISLSPYHVGAHLEAAVEFRNSGQLDAAKDVLDELLNRSPQSHAAWVQLGLVARCRGDHQEALRCFTKAAELYPSNISYQLERAQQLKTMAKDSTAQELLVELTKSHPNHIAPLIGLADLMRRRGNRLASLDFFQMAQEKEPENITLTLEIANDLRELRRYTEAEEILQNVLARRSNDARFLTALGHLKRRQGNCSASLQAFQSAAALEPNNAQAMIEFANALRDTGHFEEAAEILTGLVRRYPDSSATFISLGQLERRRGNRSAALEMFRRAASYDPHNVTLKLEITNELRELDHIEEATATVVSVLQQSPDNFDAIMQQVHLLRREGRRAESLACLKGLANRIPAQANLCIEMAADELALGNPNGAAELNDQALRLDPENLSALLQQVQFAILRQAWMHAEDTCRKAIDLHPSASWPRLEAARISFELGRRNEAFTLIDEARQRLGNLPEIAVREVELRRLMRDWDAVQQIIARERTSKLGSSFLLTMHLIEVAITTGLFERAQTELDGMVSSTAKERSQEAHLRGRLAEAKFEHNAAAGYYAAAIRLDPQSAGLQFDMARVKLLTLELDSSLEHLKAFTRLTRSWLLACNLSTNLSQNHVGQLIDEFRLDPDALNELRQLHLLPRSEQLQQLRALIQRSPEYTPISLVAAIKLRQHGAFPSLQTAVDRESIIPKQIGQYWDHDPPDDVNELMGGWKRLNPQYDWVCFDEETAREFLRVNFSQQCLRAFEVAREPAQKADLFRLAWLVQNGGVYVDADDACLAPLNSFVPPAASFVAYQEDYGSIANNFIGSVPGHPVLTNALELAVQALVRGDRELLWLSTGPGLLTRAYIWEWATSENQDWFHSSHIFALSDIQDKVGLHCPVRYKSTERHWSRTSFGRRSSRGASARSVTQLRYLSESGHCRSTAVATRHRDLQ
jgi:tetratricopeptide (TPR) repeat protein